MSINNSIDSKYMCANSAFSLNDVSYINSSTTITGSGQHNIYTAPTGYRALVNILATAQSTSSVNLNFENSGTYYNATSSLDSLTIGTPTILGGMNKFILESGETVSVNSSGGSVNIFTQIIQFSNISGLKTAKTLNLILGNNLCYTCPTGKNAILLSQPLNMFTNGTMAISNTGAIATCYYMYVPSGQLPGSNYQITDSLICIGTGIQGGAYIQSNQVCISMNEGDSIYINCTTSAAVCSFLNIYEY
jgi:hypothetical protein